MARPIKLTPTVIAAIDARRRAGDTYVQISQSLGLAQGTIRKAVETIKARAPVRVQPTEAPEEVPVTIPDGTDPGQVSRWLASTEKMLAAAEAAKEIGHYNSLMSRYLGLLEYVRKSAPPPKVDPNENPDMIALGDQVWARLCKMLDFHE